MKTTAPRRTAPTYLLHDDTRGGWCLRFAYRDSLGRRHDPRERSPYPGDYRRSVAWAAVRRAGIITEIENTLRAVEIQRTAEPTLGAVLDAYALDAQARGTRSEAARAAVLRDSLGADTPVSALTVKAVTDWRERIRQERAHTEPLSNRSLNAYSTILQAALNYAVRLGTVETNPLAQLRRLPEARRTPPALSERQVAALFAALPAWEALQADRDERKRPKVPLVTRLYLGYFTGGRPEALDALRWRDVDLRRAVLDYSSKGHPHIIVPLEPELVRHLRALHAHQDPTADNLIMPSPETGRPVDNWRTQWRVLVRLANVELSAREEITDGHTIHCLRHSRITHLLQAGVPPQAVAQITGTSVAMLHRHYAHLLVRSLADELARARQHRALRTVSDAAAGRKFGRNRDHKTREMPSHGVAPQNTKPM
jgi:integrase